MNQRQRELARVKLEEAERALKRADERLACAQRTRSEPALIDALKDFNEALGRRDRLATRFGGSVQ